MPCCLNSTSCCPQPGESPQHSRNVQTLVLRQRSAGRSPFPSPPSTPEGKGQRQTPPALALALLGFTTKTKETPRSISVLTKDISCNPQHSLLWPSQARRQKGSTAHQQHLLMAPTSTRLQQQGLSGSKGHFGAMRGGSAPPGHSRAGQGEAPAQRPRGTGLSLSQLGSQRCHEGKAQISQKWPGLGRALPKAAGPTQPGSAVTEVPAPQPTSSQGSVSSLAATCLPSLGGAAWHQDPPQPRLGDGTVLTCSSTGHRTPELATKTELTD